MKFFLNVFTCLLVIGARSFVSGEYLTVNGKEFFYGGQKVFLSGVNYAWNDYGNDFGNGRYGSTGPTLEQWIRDVAAAGGNSISKSDSETSIKVN
jgi:mannan endo-1,4-beta-mannosidase